MCNCTQNIQQIRVNENESRFFFSSSQKDLLVFNTDEMRISSGKGLNYQKKKLTNNKKRIKTN